MARNKHNYGDTEKDITFTVSQEEYEDAIAMAKAKGFSSVESLMESKYQKFMKIHRTNMMGGK